MLEKHVPQKKLKPIPENGRYWGGYRGNRFVIWSPIDIDQVRNNKQSRLICVFAAGCVWCNQWWGWTLHFDVAEKNSRIMKKRGCPVCEERISGKRLKKLIKIRKTI